MTQLSPELVTFNQGDARPKRHESYLDSSPISLPGPEEESSNVIRGYDAVAHDPEMVITGGIELPSLVDKKVKDVATIALVNPAKSFNAYEELKGKFEGIDLESVLPDVDEKDRPAVFVQELISEEISTNTGELLLGVDTSRIKTDERWALENAMVKERDEKIERLKADLVESQMRILSLRGLYENSGATTKQLDAFDSIAKLMSAPRREAYEAESAHVSVVEKIRKKAEAAFSKIAVKRAGLFRPMSE